jgi:glutamate-1-semialdehyde 2,1-aminomutase
VDPNPSSRLPTERAPARAPIAWAERARAVIPGGASTGSKRSEALYGEGGTGPTHYLRASGCRLTTVDGQELVDCTMALGAVAFGYADAEVTDAVTVAAREGNVAGLSHALEVTVAEQLCAQVPFAEQVRFLKTGAEAVAAAVRIARTHTGRSHVLGCGYFGWLDWCSDAAGVPDGTRQAFGRIPFGDSGAAERAVARVGADLAAVVVEPVIERMAPVAWLRALRELCTSSGAVLIADEIKTGFRVHPAGGVAASGVHPDLAVFGKALANGYPLAAVVGPAGIMHSAERTWISSTLASEATALAAASVVLARHAREDVCGQLTAVGDAMHERVRRACLAAGASDVRIDGIAPMWMLRFRDADVEARVLAGARDAGVLLKRGAYNFAALAHDAAAMEALERALAHALRREHARDA